MRFTDAVNKNLRNDTDDESMEKFLLKVTENKLIFEFQCDQSFLIQQQAPKVSNRGYQNVRSGPNGGFKRAVPVA